MVEKMILSFGLNNRTQKLPDTAVKELQRLLKIAKTRFPHAEILIPEVNFSRAIPLGEQENLNYLNNYITEHCEYIVALPQQEFHTDRDKIHWTRATALTFSNYWLEYLN